MHGPKSTPIAIIGMSCRFPGDSTNPDKLWELCAEKRSAWSKIPEDRFNGDAFIHPQRQHLGTFNATGAHFVSGDVAEFDAPFFNFTADVAKSMDPQLRWLLETVFEAFEDAGIPIEEVAGSRTAVFAGNCFRDYHDMAMRDLDNLPRNFCTGNMLAMTANRVSHFFDLRGPSVSLDTACSTGLTALHLACQALRTGEANTAVVGAANLILHPGTIVSLSSAGLLGPDGRSYAFDSRAEGYGRGEGIASLILRPLADALANGDPICAVIRETVINQDGKTLTLTSPSQRAQEEMIGECYERACLNPLDTPYVEAHGTGTIAGDTIEMGALGRMLGMGRPPDQPLLVGSIKSNIGHLEATSGLAAVIKAVKMLQHRQIPPQALLETLNPQIDFDTLQIKVPTELQRWPKGQLRRISVNNFGAGGANAHVILEDASYHRRPHPGPLNSEESKAYVFTWSAKDEQGVRRAVQELATRFDQIMSPGWTLADLAYTTGQRRSRFPWRIAVSASNETELKAAITDPIQPVHASGTRRPRLGFVFTGQGAQWFAMGRGLRERYPVYAQSLEQAEQYVSELGASWSVIEELSRDKDHTRIDTAALSFPLTVIVQLSLVRLLRSWGVNPTAVTGHSSGEISAAYAVGALTFEQAIAVAFLRGKLTEEFVKRDGPAGGMIALGIGKDEVQEYLCDLPSKRCVIACINSPSSVTISGDIAAIDEVEARAAERQVFARRLKVAGAYHSHHMDLFADDYLAALRPHLDQTGGKSSSILLSSPVTGTFVDPAEVNTDPDHWIRNMTGCVLFEDSLRQMVVGNHPGRLVSENRNVDVLIEIGPHGALKGPVQQTLRSIPELGPNGIPYLSCLTRGEDACYSMQSVAAWLHCRGYPINLSAVNFPDVGHITPPRVVQGLGQYPWNHTVRYWHQPGVDRDFTQRKKRRHPLLGALVEGLSPGHSIWRNVIRESDIPWLREHLIQSGILFPGAGLMVNAMTAMAQIQTDAGQPWNGFHVRKVQLFNALIVPHTTEGIEVQLCIDKPAARHLDPDGFREFSINSRRPEGEWTSHCFGEVVSVSQGQMQSPLPPSPMRLWPVNIPRFYKYLEQVGPTLGPSFQLVTSLMAGEGHTLATVRIVEGASEYWTDPPTLDACFHSAYAGVPRAQLLQMGISIPTSIRSLRVSTAVSLAAGDTLTVASFIERIDAQGFEVSCTVFCSTVDGLHPILRGEGIYFRSLGAGAREGQASQIQETLRLQTQWRPDISVLSSAALRNYLMARRSECTASAPWVDDLRSYIQLYSHKTPRARVLEIGAGDVHCSNALVDGLKHGHSAQLWVERLELTNESMGPLDELRRILPTHEGQITYRTLDVNNSLSGQGFQTEWYDIVVISDLSLVKEAGTALSNVRTVMKPGGRLILLNRELFELGGSESVSHRTVDSRVQLLSQAPFAGVDLTLSLNNASSPSTWSLLFSTPLGPAVDSPSQRQVTLVISPDDPPPSEWLKELVHSLQHISGVGDIRLVRWGDSMQQVDRSICICLVELTCPMLIEMNHRDFTTLRDMLKAARDTLWLSRSGLMEGGSPEGALHVGLFRTLRLEDQNKRFITLDLDPTRDPWMPAAVQAIKQVIQKTLASVDSDEHEFEYLERNGELHVPRLVMQQGNSQVPSDSSQRPFPIGGPALRLKAQVPGQLNTLAFHEIDGEGPDSLPGSSMLTIEPRAFGLNFRDIMVTNGQMEDRTMGFECAGIITAVGEEASQRNFQVGDRVCALLPAGHWSNTVRVPWTGVAHIPAEMDFTTAASLPMIFTTAHHALVDIARLTPEDTVLIHAAAGGVGQAAILIAQHIGARVFATVGSDQKREFLTQTYGIPADCIFSSRDRSFLHGVREKTDGQGVDVVLNSLAGPLLQASWDCIGPFGRFVELGKRDLEQNKHLEMRHFAQSVSYTAIDIVQLGRHRGKQVSRLLQHVVDLVSTNKITSRIPITTYKLSEVEDAFRLMLKGHHIGKIVVTVEAGDPVPMIRRTQGIHRQMYGSHLIVGGWKGIGGEIAKWMATRGAEDVILMSRNADTHESRQFRDQLLQTTGTRVHLISCDITNMTDLQRVLTDYESRVSPIRGVIQAAAVLQDTTWENMTHEQWQKALQPKVHGTRNLDEYFQCPDLDYFVVLSSITGVIGSLGQANYTAAGTYQDHLTMRRRQRGLPGTVIDLGSVLSVGIAARSKGVHERLERSGYAPHEIQDVLDLVASAVNGDAHSAQIITGVSRWQVPGDIPWRHELRFACLQMQSSDATSSTSQPSMLYSSTALKAQLKELSGSRSEVEKFILQVVQARLAQLFTISESNVDPQLPLSRYGVDSLVAVELRNWMTANIVSTINIFDLTQSASLIDLSRRLADKFLQQQEGTS